MPTNNEKRYVGVVYLTVLCDYPYLVSLLFAVLLSVHRYIVNGFYCLCKFLAAGTCLS